MGRKIFTSDKIIMRLLKIILNFTNRKREFSTVFYNSLQD